MPIKRISVISWIQAAYILRIISLHRCGWMICYLLRDFYFLFFFFFLCVCLCVCAYIPICVTSYDCHHCCNWCFSVCCSYNRRAGALNYYDPLSIVPIVVVSPIIWSLVLLLMTAVVVVPGVSLWRAVRVLCLPTAVPTAFAGCSWKGF